MMTLQHIPHVIDRVMGDGEDFELLFTIDPGYWPTLTLAWPFETAIHNVGWLSRTTRLALSKTHGLMKRPSIKSYAGFEHKL